MEFAKRNGIKAGIIFGIIAVVYAFTVYIVNEAWLAKWWVNTALFVAGLFFFIWAMVKSKRDMGGFITFREAFSAFMIAAIVYMAISTLSNILLFQVIDTELADRTKERIIEQTVSWLEKMNVPEEQLDETIAKMEEDNTFGMGNQLKGFLFGIIFFAVIGAISAAIVNKNKPIWDAIDN